MNNFFKALACALLLAPAACDQAELDDLGDDVELDDLDEEFDEDVEAEAPSLDGPDALAAVPDTDESGWKGPISDGTPPMSCDANEAVTNMWCAGPYCDNVYMACNDWGKPHDGRTWMSFISEETAPVRCDDNHAIMTGLACRGSYCDDLSVECAGTTATLHDCRWVNPYTPHSEEQGGFSAPWGEVITGIECQGSNCDNKIYRTCKYS